MVKVSFIKALDSRWMSGFCVVTMHDRTIARFRIGVGDDHVFANSVDQAVAKAVDAATEAANGIGAEFGLYDIDYSGLRSIELARLAAA